MLIETLTRHEPTEKQMDAHYRAHRIKDMTSVQVDEWETSEYYTPAQPEWTKLLQVQDAKVIPTPAIWKTYQGSSSPDFRVEYGERNDVAKVHVSLHPVLKIKVEDLLRKRNYVIYPKGKLKTKRITLNGKTSHYEYTFNGKKYEKDYFQEMVTRDMVAPVLKAIRSQLIEHMFKDKEINELDLFLNSVLKYAKNPSTNEIKTALHHDAMQLEFLPEASEEMKLLAVTNKPDAIKFIQRPSLDLQIAATLRNQYAYRLAQYITTELPQNCQSQIIKSFVGQYAYLYKDEPNPLHFIINPSATTIEAALASRLTIPKSWISLFNDDLVKKALDSDARLYYPLIQTIDSDGKYRKWHIEGGKYGLFPFGITLTEEEKTYLIEKKASYIKYIKNPSEELLLKAIRANPYLYSEIRDEISRGHYHDIKLTKKAKKLFKELTKNDLKDE